jgi:hypothetical protein
MATINKAWEREAKALEFFTRIAELCGCTCTIDFENNVVNFEGPEHAKAKVIEAVEKFLA